MFNPRSTFVSTHNRNIFNLMSPPERIDNRIHK